MKPSIGRIVHYTFAEYDDFSQVEGARVNKVEAGQVYPAMIVRTWGEDEGDSCNLQVFLDGNVSYWATSRVEGDQPGQWAVPPRV